MSNASQNINNKIVDKFPYETIAFSEDNIKAVLYEGKV